MGRLALAVLLFVGCTYRYGKPPTNPVAFNGVGWDSGLAFGDATASASHYYAHPENPTRVTMGCQMYGIKPLMAAAGGVAAGSTKDQESAVAIGVATVIMVFLIPNCFATLEYERSALIMPPPAPTPPSPTAAAPVSSPAPTSTEAPGPPAAPYRPVPHPMKKHAPPPATTPAPAAVPDGDTDAKQPLLDPKF